jgi:ABC-type multidrug transport system fused ATPase/permease subunit
VQFEHADIAYRKDTPLDDPEALTRPAELVTVLRDIDITLSAGRTLALVGPVGSGKSSVLLAALGETRVVKGAVRTYGSVAYVPQFAWVQAGTVRNNILFGLPYDEERYRRVIHACALERDLQIMPQGDMSMVAERGTNLSGGL